MTREVLVDVDDTLCETQKKINEFVRKETGQKITLADVTLQLREDDGSDYQRLARLWLNRPEQVLACKPYPTALTGIQLLHQADYQIHVASSRKAPLHDVTEKWLEQHGFTEYIVAFHPRADNLGSVEFKLQVANKTGTSVAFDDTLKVAESLAGNGVFVYLIDRPWNKGHSQSAKIVRRKSFYQAVQHHLKNSSKL